MFRRLFGLFLACMFLTGSTLLPLSDFSLLQELPGMYRNYSVITTSDELGVMDFVGDYLLQGKELFGNNRQDKAQTGDNGVQFQHQASPLQVILAAGHLTLILISESEKEHPVTQQPFLSSTFRNKLFRPPLA